MKKELFWDSEPDLLQIVQDLQAEKIVLGESDTVLGLLAKASLYTKEGLDGIKNRAKKPYLVLIGSLKQAGELINYPELRRLGIDEPVRRLLESSWPGPLTVVLPASKNAPSFLVAPNNSIGIRVPRHAGLQAVLEKIPYLFSTSANKSGSPIPSSIDEVSDDIKSKVECIVKNQTTGFNSTEPSTIIDCTGEKIMVIREGAYPVKLLERHAGISFAH